MPTCGMFVIFVIYRQEMKNAKILLFSVFFQKHFFFQFLEFVPIFLNFGFFFLLIFLRKQKWILQGDLFLFFSKKHFFRKKNCQLNCQFLKIDFFIFGWHNVKVSELPPPHGTIIRGVPKFRAVFDQQYSSFMKKKVKKKPVFSVFFFVQPVTDWIFQK